MNMLTLAQMRDVGCHSGYVLWDHSGKVEGVSFSEGRLKAMHPATWTFSHVISVKSSYRCIAISSSMAQTIFSRQSGRYPRIPLHSNSDVSHGTEICESELRQLVGKAIQAMSLDDLKRICIPVGVVLDCLKKPVR
jgi:hypothetical protein